MIWLYRIIILPFFILTAPYFISRMLKRGGYGKNFKHRFGLLPSLPKVKPGVTRIWIQSVSVGETNALLPLLKMLKESKIEVVLTTTTSTAYKIIEEKYTDLVLAYAYFPIDFFIFSKLAWARLKPTHIVLMESELWPEHLYHANAKNKPTILINARISDRTFHRYKKFSFVAKRILNQLQLICASTQNDYERFLELNVSPDKIKCTGNMKFDAAAANPLSPEEILSLKKDLGFTGELSEKILHGCSTWKGEEKMLLDTFKEMRKSDPSVKLLIAPRHAERRNEIIDLLKNFSEKWILRSTNKKAPTQNFDICIADTTGELNKLNQVATIAYIGKSLDPENKGGQTPIECAAAGIPIVYGPYMTNFKDACRDLERINAAIKVNSTNEAQKTLTSLIFDKTQQLKMQAAAQKWHHANQGATERIFKELQTLFTNT